MKFTDEHRKLAKAVYEDLVKTYPQMTLEVVMNEAKSIIEGENKPSGIIGVWLDGYFRRANLK